MTIIFAYFGPETTLPVASLLTAVLGFVLMTGRSSVRLVTQWFRALAGSPSPPAHRRPAEVPVGVSQLASPSKAGDLG